MEADINNTLLSDEYRRVQVDGAIKAAKETDELASHSHELPPLEANDRSGVELGRNLTDDYSA